MGLVAVLAAAGPAGAVTRLVDSDGAATTANCDAGGAGSASTTIQAAINAATAGVDDIQVCPGTYPELVTVNKSLVLKGPRAGVDARDASRTGLPATEAVVVGTGSGASQTTAFNVTADNVTLDGFTTQGTGSAGTFGFSIFLGASTYGHVLENNIVQNSIAGISLGSDFTTIRRNVIRNNNNPGPVSGTGIYTDQFQAGGSLTGGTIESNRFSGNSNVGVLLGATSAGSQSNFAVSNNSFENNGNAAVFFNLSGSTFTRNVATNSTGSQILIGGRVQGLGFTENVIASGQSRGLRVGDFGGGGTNSGVTVRCNIIINNGLAGLEIDSTVAAYTGTLDAGFNWWGSATGPTIASNPGGTGENIVDPGSQVAYRPFLSESSDGSTAPGFQCAGPRAAITDVTGPESGTLDFTVTLTNPSQSPVTIGYATQDGTAGAGDYQAVADTLTFAPGEQSKTISVPVVSDAADEPDETFRVELLSPSGTAITDGEGVGTIQDDDPPPDPPDTRAPVVSATPAKLPRLAKALAKGFKVRVTSDEAGLATVASGSNATGTAALAAAGTKSVTVKFTTAARKKFKSRRKNLTLSLRVTVADAAGNRNTPVKLSATLKP